MSSPNEPANGDGARAAGTQPTSSEGSGVTYRGDVPPWVRGQTTRAQRRRQQEAGGDPLTRPEPTAEATRQSGGTSSTGPGMDERINRFISGSSPSIKATEPAPAPPKSPEPEPAPARPEAYRSELPDLSGPAPRPRPQQRPRKATAERSSSESGGSASASSSSTSSSGSRVQVARPRGGPVRASMQIRRVDPWTVLKVSLVLSIALFFIWMIAVAFLYLVLGGMGVWSKLNSNVGDLLTNTSNAELVSSGAIFGGAALIGLVNIVLLTAMATVGAFIYNLTTDLVGGVEVTLADRD